MLSMFKLWTWYVGRIVYIVPSDIQWLFKMGTSSYPKAGDDWFLKDSKFDQILPAVEIP